MCTRSHHDAPRRLTSSRKGVKLGTGPVAPGGAGGASSTKGRNVFAGACAGGASIFSFATLDFAFAFSPRGAGAPGPASPAPGPCPGAGSRNGTIRAPPDPEPDAAPATRFERPAWRSVVPTSFFTSGAFSLTRALRVPSSPHVPPSVASPASPVGSTKICKRALLLEDAGTGGATEGAANREDDAGSEDAVVASARRGAAARVGAGSSRAASGRGAFDIMRFWKSA